MITNVMDLSARDTSGTETARATAAQRRIQHDLSFITGRRMPGTEIGSDDESISSGSGLGTGFGSDVESISSGSSVTGSSDFDLTRASGTRQLTKAHKLINNGPRQSLSQANSCKKEYDLSNVEGWNRLKNTLLQF